MEELTGQSIKGYELLERIGSGGFGAVYRAYQSTIGREVAVKIILPGFANHPDFIRRFELEAQLIARLEHLHIVPLYDFWREPGNAYLVMRWLRGGSIRDALADRPFALQPAALLLDQIASALTAAHDNGIVHRDLKPPNILMDNEGNAYLADFSIAKDLRSTNGRQSGQDAGRSALGRGLVGSPDYIAPEQIRGEAVTNRTDIYGLGITLYEILTGGHPFKGFSAPERLFKQLNDSLPAIDGLDPIVQDGVNDVIRKATAKDPRQRFSNVLSMSAAFRKACRLDGNGQAADFIESLTFREQEILHLIVQGHTNRQIAQEIVIEISTVKWHIKNIYNKLGVRSRLQAVARAREMEFLIPAGATSGESETAEPIGVSIVRPEPANPYKGLRAFEPADSRDFFGREALVDHLLARMTLPKPEQGSGSADGERFLAIVGPSGSGKSSLVKGGLIPALWSGKLPGSEKWFVSHLIPSAHPLDDLEVALTRIAASKADNLRSHLERDNMGLFRAANQILPQDDGQLVLIIDQFEELFTVVEDEQAQRALMSLIHGAVSNPRSRVRVIITLRADFYDRPLQVPHFGELVRSHMVTLLPLSAGELERAIVKPAERVGVSFEEGLVPTIIEEVNDRPGALPLLQYALTELFEQRRGRPLTGESYAALGGVAGALARRAEELYQEQGETGQEAIRQMFLRLVTAGDGGPGSEDHGTAEMLRRVPRSELLSAAADPDSLDELIDIYADYRLLSLDHEPATRRPTVEVAHEAILREWERLRDWLEENRADLALHRQLIRATRDWERGDRDESFLLRGARLARFNGWAADTQLVFTEAERVFLETCVAKQDETAALERRRQEEEERLERRASRRLRALVAVLTLALIVAIGLTIVAFSFAAQAEELQQTAEQQQGVAEEQRALAEEQRALAVARELASAAFANLDSNPELSVLLALKAIETTQAFDGSVLPEAEDILRQAVIADRVQMTIPMEGKLAYNYDGTKLAVGNATGVVGMWDLTTGGKVNRYYDHVSWITGLVFSLDGRYLLSGSSGGRVVLRDLEAGRVQVNLYHESDVSAVAIAPDNKHVAAASADGLVQVWDVSSTLDPSSEDAGRPVQMEPGPVFQTPEEATALAFNPDGRSLVAFVPGWQVVTWDISSGEVLASVLDASSFSSGMALSRDGRQMATAIGEVGVTVWDTSSGEERFTLLEGSPVAQVAFSQDGNRLAIVAKNGMVTLWDTKRGMQVAEIGGRTSGIIYFALHPDGQHVATSGSDGMTRIWDLDPFAGGEFLTVNAHTGQIHDVVYSPRGTTFATTGIDGRVRLWDSESGRLVHSFEGQQEAAHFPAFSEDGSRLAAVNGNGGVTVWEVDSGEALLTLDTESATLSTITFSPDGSTLAASGLEGVIYVWDATSGSRLLDFAHQAEITRLLYARDGNIIWSYDHRGWARSWNANTGEQVMTLGSEQAVCDTIIWDAEITPDGRYWGVSGFDGKAHIYQNQEPNSAAPYSVKAHSLQGHTGNLTGLAFHPLAPLVATSGFDGSSRIWDLNTGEELLKLTGSTSPVQGIDFSPDGRHLAAAGADGVVRVYLVSLEELMNLARSRLSRELTTQECRKFLHLPSCSEE